MNNLNKLKIGDVVKVISGELEGRIGIIVRLPHEGKTIVMLRFATEDDEWTCLVESVRKFKITDEILL